MGIRILYFNINIIVVILGIIMIWKKIKELKVLLYKYGF